jgi:hypothetical protein
VAAIPLPSGRLHDAVHAWTRAAMELEQLEDSPPRSEPRARARLAMARASGHSREMGQPAGKPRETTYADLVAAPKHMVSEIINGTLRTHPRPASPHAFASSELGYELVGPFQRGKGGPGGRWILDEPELHFPNPAVRIGKDVVVPDLAGWRKERMPRVPRVAYFTLAPDWICEVLSPSTETEDREEKMPIYARVGVRWAWLLDPIAQTLEVFVLGKDSLWGQPTTYRDSARVRPVPFDALELDLAGLWIDLQ